MASVSPLRQAGGQAFVNAGQLQNSMVTNLIYSVAATKNFCNQCFLNNRVRVALTAYRYYELCTTRKRMISSVFSFAHLRQ